MTNATTKTVARAAKAAKPKAPAKVASGHKPLAKAEQAPVIRLKGNRKYRPLVKLATVAAKPGTWRYTMIATVLAAKDTDAAKRAVPDAFAGKNIDFAFLSANKYIEFA
jgi:hypothetical protein